MEDGNSHSIVKIEPPRGLGVIVVYLSKAVDPVIRHSSVISAVAVAFMMFITFFNVIGRAAFNLPVRGYFESVEFAMVLMTVFGIGYCALSKGHIRVDVLSSYASRRVNCVMDIFAFGTAFIFYVLVSWQGVLNALTYLKDGRTSSVLHIPVYPFIFLLVIGAAFVALIFLRDFLKAMYEVKR